MKRRSASHEYLIEMSQSFVTTKIGQTKYEDLCLFVAALVQPKLLVALEGNKKLVELSKVVGEVLYRFNKPKMADLLSYPQFCFLLKNFLSMPDLIEFIGDKSTSPQAKENLSAQIEYLAAKCEATLSIADKAELGDRYRHNVHINTTQTSTANLAACRFIE